MSCRNFDPSRLVPKEGAWPRFTNDHLVLVNAAGSAILQEPSSASLAVKRTHRYVRRWRFISIFSRTMHRYTIHHERATLRVAEQRVGIRKEQCFLYSGYSFQVRGTPAIVVPNFWRFQSSVPSSACQVLSPDDARQYIVMFRRCLYIQGARKIYLMNTNQSLYDFRFRRRTHDKDLDVREARRYGRCVYRELSGL